MSITVTLAFPADLEEKLRREAVNLDAAVTEAFALELFRRGTLSHYELSRVLGLDRHETDAYLQRHRVYEGSLTMADLDADRETVAKLD